MFNNVKIKLQKNSPELLVGAGIVGIIGATVLACKATTKASAIFEEHKTEMEIIKKVNADEDLKADHDYDEKEYRKDLAIRYTKTSVELIKLYAPSFILGTLSIGMVLKSHDILKKRNIAMGAAYTILNENFGKYKERVKEHLGDEAEKNLRYNLKKEKTERVETDEDGEEKKVEETVDIIDETTVGEYAKFFDEYNENWTKDPEHNLFFLKAQERYANDLLQSKGILFLNEVYKMLGIPETKAGQVVGWVKDSEIGDGYVDFGIYNVHRKSNREFVNGYERSVLLDFNPDGVVWELLSE